MRIISGTHRSRRLQSPPNGAITRPMPARVRESVFNMLSGHLDGASVLDCFAGIGGVGLEAISRGASRCVCIERDRRVSATLRANIESLGETDRCHAATADALGVSVLSRCPHPVRLIFFDPPYPMLTDPGQRERVLGQLGRLIGKLEPDGYALLRTPWPLAERPITPVSEEEPPGEACADAAVSAERIPPADLTIPCALGPETHTYGTMAVHFYMRPPESPPESPSDSPSG